MKNIFIYPVCILFLLCRCKDSQKNTEEEKKEFAVEIICGNKQPYLYEAASFVAKVSGAEGAVEVSWDFGDGTQGAGVSVQHGFRTAGQYIVLAKASSGQKNIYAVQTITAGGISLSRVLKNFDRSRVWLMAHRGITGDMNVPENSISALKNCIKLRKTIGLELMETDPRITKDGEIVIMHDETINRTTNGTGKVSDHTLAQLKQFRLKNQDGTLSNEQIPTVREFLMAAKDSLFIDLDYKNNVPMLALYNLVKELGMLDQCYFVCGTSTEDAQSLLSFSPPAVVSCGVGSESGLQNLKNYGVHISAISPNNMLTTSLAVGAAQRGLVVQSQTLVQDGITFDYEISNHGNYEGVDILVNKGINILQSNYTPLVHNYLVNQNKR